MAHFQSTKHGWPSKTTGPTGFPRFKPLSIQIKQNWWNIFPYWQSSTDYVYILFPSCNQTVSFFPGFIYRSPLLRQFAAIVLINPVSGYTCIIRSMYICTFRFAQRFSPIGKRKCLVIRQFFLAEITFGRKKISAHENRIFINIASPLKKKNLPPLILQQALRDLSLLFSWGRGARGFFWGGGGSTWFSGRTKWASVVANRVKRLSYRILTANERGL